MGSFLSHSGEQSTEVSHAEVAAGVESAERVINIKVCEWGENRTIDLSVTEEQFKSMTALQLKERIEPLFGLPVRDQELLINGVQLAGGGMLFSSDRYMWLEDDRLLSDYGIQDGSTIHLSEVIMSGSNGAGWGGGGMGDREGRNQSMDCVAIMLTGSDVSSESAPHPQPAAVEDLHKDSR